MDFDLSTEQQAIRDTCRDFAREVVAPAAEQLDRDHAFGYDVVRQMGELGLFGLPFPEEYGGAGGDFLSLCLAIEEISRADTGVGITLEAAVCLGAFYYNDLYDFEAPHDAGQLFTRLCRALGFAALVLTTAAGPLVPALNSYWLKIHVTAAATASGLSSIVLCAVTSAGKV